MKNRRVCVSSDPTPGRIATGSAGWGVRVYEGIFDLILHESHYFLLTNMDCENEPL